MRILIMALGLAATLGLVATRLAVCAACRDAQLVEIPWGDGGMRTARHGHMRTISVGLLCLGWSAVRGVRLLREKRRA